jgi:hypothetical protein
VKNEKFDYTEWEKVTPKQKWYKNLEKDNAKYKHRFTNWKYCPLYKKFISKKN